MFRSKGLPEWCSWTPASQASLLQDLEVEQELRLGQVQLLGEVADAALTVAEGLDHLQADRIG